MKSLNFKDGAVVAHFDLEGIGGHAGMSQDPNRWLLITRASNRIQDAPASQYR